MLLRHGYSCGETIKLRIEPLSVYLRSRMQGRVTLVTDNDKSDGGGGGGKRGVVVVRAFSTSVLGDGSWKTIADVHLRILCRNRIKCEKLNCT